MSQNTSWFVEIDGESKEDRRIRYRRESAKRYKSDPERAEARRKAKREFHARRQEDSVRRQAEIDRQKAARAAMDAEKREVYLMKARIRAAQWHEANRDYALARNAEKIQYFRDYVANNRARYRAHHNKRRAAKINATPPWADLQKIREVYEEAARLQADTGVIHEVDHIVPLRGKNVCGLHVHWNLRAVPRDENRKKSNRLIGSLLECPINAQAGEYF